MGEARQRREEERRRQEIFAFTNSANILFNHFLYYKIPNFLQHEKLIITRLIREQQRQVSKVLLDGLYDPDSLLFILLGDHHVFMKEVWKVLVEDWQIFPDQ